MQDLEIYYNTFISKTRPPSLTHLSQKMYIFLGKFPCWTVVKKNRRYQTLHNLNRSSYLIWSLLIQTTWNLFILDILANCFLWMISSESPSREPTFLTFLNVSVLQSLHCRKVCSVLSSFTLRFLDGNTAFTVPIMWLFSSLVLEIKSVNQNKQFLLAS